MCNTDRQEWEKSFFALYGSLKQLRKAVTQAGLTLEGLLGQQQTQAAQELQGVLQQLHAAANRAQSVLDQQEAQAEAAQVVIARGLQLHTQAAHAGAGMSARRQMSTAAGRASDGAAGEHCAASTLQQTQTGHPAEIQHQLQQQQQEQEQLQQLQPQLAQATTAAAGALGHKTGDFVQLLRDEDDVGQAHSALWQQQQPQQNQQQRVHVEQGTQQQNSKPTAASPAAAAADLNVGEAAACPAHISLQEQVHLQTTQLQRVQQCSMGEQYIAGLPQQDANTAGVAAPAAAASAVAAAGITAAVTEGKTVVDSHSCRGVKRCLQQQQPATSDASKAMRMQQHAAPGTQSRAAAIAAGSCAMTAAPSSPEFQLQGASSMQDGAAATHHQQQQQLWGGVHSTAATYENAAPAGAIAATVALQHKHVTANNDGCSSAVATPVACQAVAYGAAAEAVVVKGEPLVAGGTSPPEVATVAGTCERRPEAEAAAAVGESTGVAQQEVQGLAFQSCSWDAQAAAMVGTSSAVRPAGAAGADPARNTGATVAAAAAAVTTPAAYAGAADAAPATAAPSSAAAAGAAVPATAVPDAEAESSADAVATAAVCDTAAGTAEAEGVPGAEPSAPLSGSNAASAADQQGGRDCTSEATAISPHNRNMLSLYINRLSDRSYTRTDQKDAAKQLLQMVSVEEHGTVAAAAAAHKTAITELGGVEALLALLSADHGCRVTTAAGEALAAILHKNCPGQDAVAAGGWIEKLVQMLPTGEKYHICTAAAVALRSAIHNHEDNLQRMLALPSLLPAVAALLSLSVDDVSSMPDAIAIWRAATALAQGISSHWSKVPDQQQIGPLISGLLTVLKRHKHSVVRGRTGERMMEVLLSAVHCLYKLCNSSRADAKVVADASFAAGGIDVLLDLLKAADKEEQIELAQWTARTIGSVLRDCKACKDAFSAQGGNEFFTTVLVRKTAVTLDYRAAVACAVKYAAADCPAAQNTARQLGVIRLLAGMLSNYRWHKRLQSDAAAALRTLITGNEANQLEAARQGIVQKLIPLLDIPDDEGPGDLALILLNIRSHFSAADKQAARLQAAKTLTELCSHPVPRRQATASIKPLLNLLSSHNSANSSHAGSSAGSSSGKIAIATAAAAALRQVIREDDGNQEELVQQGGVDVIVRVLMGCSQESISSSSQVEQIVLHTVATILDMVFVYTAETVPVTKHRYKAAFVAAGGVQPLLALLQRASGCTNCTVWANIASVVASALRYLALEHPQNRDAICQAEPHVIPLLVKLLRKASQRRSGQGGEMPGNNIGGGVAEDDASSLDVSGSAGSGLDGSGRDGSDLDVSGSDGSGLDGSDVDGSSSDGSDVDGSGSDGSDVDGSGSDGSDLDGSGSDGSDVDGSSSDAADGSIAIQLQGAIIISNATARLLCDVAAALSTLAEGSPADQCKIVQLDCMPLLVRLLSCQISDPELEVAGFPDDIYGEVAKVLTTVAASQAAVAKAAGAVEQLKHVVDQVSSGKARQHAMAALRALERDATQ